MEFPDRKDFIDRSDCYMWGPDIFVIPITEKGQHTVKIDFPDGKPWFNLYTDERVVPEQWVSLARCFWGTKMKSTWSQPTEDTLSLDNIPVFVKAGAFIPMAKKGIQSTADYSMSEVEIHFYYDPSVEKSTGKWFEDDGLTFQDFTANGACYSLFEFDYQKKHGNHGEVSVNVTSPYCKPFSPGVTLVIHNVDNPPKVRGRKNRYSFGSAYQEWYDPSTKTLRLSYGLFADNRLKIKFK